MKNLLATTAIVTAAMAGTTANAQGFGSGAYVNIFGGYDVMTTTTEATSDADSLEFDWEGAGGFNLGAAVGLEISSGLRAEAEISYSTQDVDSVSLEGGSVDVEDVTLTNTYLLANVWYDVPMGAGSLFTPYVGGGLGAGIVDIGEVDVDADADGIDPATGLAYQVGAGVQVAVGPGAVDLSYRFRGVVALEFDNDVFAPEFTLEGSSVSNSLQAGYILKF
mgnify:CR=1 FL=1